MAASGGSMRFSCTAGSSARTLKTPERFVVFSTKNQVNKGTRWMPWHLEPMKDVGGCDKPRGAADQALIRGFPNGETHPW